MALIIEAGLEQSKAGLARWAMARLACWAAGTLAVALAVALAASFVAELTRPDLLIVGDVTIDVVGRSTPAVRSRVGPLGISAPEEEGFGVRMCCPRGRGSLARGAHGRRT